MIEIPAWTLAQNLWLAGIGVATGLATVVGGAFALRFRSRQHLVLGFSAGAVIAVALFDLLPEASSSPAAVPRQPRPSWGPDPSATC